MAKQSIFRIDEEYEQLLNLIDEQDGEITEVQEEQLKELGNSIETKARNFAYIVNRELANQEIIDNEIKRLQSIKKSSERKVTYIKGIVSWLLHKYGNLNKSGNLVLDLVDVKLSTRNTEVVRFSDEQVSQLFDNTILGQVSQDKLEDAKDYFSAELSVKVPATRIKDIYDQLAYLELSDYKIEPKVNKTILKKRIKDGLEDSVSNYIEARLYDNESIIIK